jgi:hypothetical protein
LRSGREFAQRLGAGGRRLVPENFTIDRMVRRTMEIYHQVFL